MGFTASCLLQSETVFVINRQQNNLLGIALMLTAMMLFPFMDALAKWLVLADISATQVIAIRSWMMLTFILIYLVIRGQTDQLKTRQPFAHLGRGLLGFVAPFTFFTALKDLPLADATVVFFSSTFILTALSAILFKERVGIHRWSAVVIGFVGVVIAMNPKGDGELNAYLLVLCAATMYSFLFLSGKQLSKKDTVISLVFSLNLMMGAVSTALLPQVWVPVSSQVIVVLLLMSVIALAAHIILTMAFSRAQVSALAPFEYTSLIWAALVGYLVWSDVPSLQLWIGAVIIVGSGLYVIHRESLRQRLG